MDRNGRKPKKDRTNGPDPNLLTHIRSLGLSTVEEYVGWCAQNGFGRRADKHWRLQLKVRSDANRAIADARLAQKRQELRQPEKVIERIFNGDVQEHHCTQHHLKAICRAFKSAQECRRTQFALHDLLRHVSVCSDLVSGRPVISQYGCQVGNTFVDGLLALARQSLGWIRPVGDWKPQTHNARRQFSSLARHLFAEWPVPAFVDSVWFLGNGREAVRQQEWFLHIGRGHNIRTADLPLAYTKRMAHQFMHAPSDLTVESALRWGQIHGLGGTARLVWCIAGTRLGSSFEHDEFWTTVLQFFIANPMLDLAHVGPIIDYIHLQRFVSQDVFVAPGVVERRGPPQPNFTMRGRTPASLLRQVEAWHRTLTKTEQPQAQWPRSRIDSFEFVEGAERGGNLKIWSITELLSTKALVAEGRAMKHCVATYAHSCTSGARSIWTLEVETFEGRSKILTVEIENGARLICQARGKCNMLPGEKHRAILRRWAERAGLSLAKYV
jgi:PcfJ-like protein